MRYDIIIAANEWWVGLRPLEWTEAQHLENPLVNTTAEREKALATAVSNSLKAYYKDIKRHG